MQSFINEEKRPGSQANPATLKSVTGVTGAAAITECDNAEHGVTNCDLDAISYAVGGPYDGRWELFLGYYSTIHNSALLKAKALANVIFAELARDQ